MESKKKQLTRSLDQKLTLSRRNFVKTAATVTAAVAAVPLEPLLRGENAFVKASVVPYGSAARAAASLNYRTSMAQAENIDVGVQPDNGDAAAFTDFSCSYSKGLAHDALGIPNAASWLSMKNALTTGNFSDFENIIVGTPGGGPNSRLNGPQGALAFDLQGIDSHASVIPPAPSVTSAQTAAEAVEHYWGSVLADVPFTQYGTNPLVAQACADMNKLSFVKGNANNQFPSPVTPDNLFRGRIFANDGNVRGPYISQFLLKPTFYGAQELSQRYQTFLPVGGAITDFMTTPSEYQLIQNGGDSGRQLAIDPTFRFIRNGRDLAAYTHVDVLYQAYFVALLVLGGLNAPPNPGMPYIGSNTQKAFGTLGGPDVAGTIAEMATRALKASWFHKWIKDLRMRPEEYGALVHANLTNTTPVPQAARALHKDVFKSNVLPLIFSTYGSYLLPQAFPEGSPTHPCYPTGHGTVGGACCTLLKFFFDGNFVIPNPVVPTPDGLSLLPFSGPPLTVNGELSKLAFNISIGHGVHSGIHFRSSTHWSILLGEQVALSVLRDRARSYNEPFTVNITKFDGTTATISNQ
jgi:hypothetical protein